MWLNMDGEAASVGFVTAASLMTLAAVYVTCLEVVSVPRMCLRKTCKVSMGFFWYMTLAMNITNEESLVFRGCP